MTGHLPQRIEQAYLAEAQRKGVSIDSLVADVLLLHAPEAEPTLPITAPTLSAKLEFVKEQGVFVLRSGQPLEAAVVDETLHSIRIERESLARGSF